MNKLVVPLLVFGGAFLSHAAQVDQVIVRQQWPWSTDVKIEYRLSGVTTPVKVNCNFFDGTTALTPAKASETVKGDLYASQSGVGVIVLDPIVAFGAGKAALADFRVELSLSDAPGNIGEILYKIYDLDDGSCTDVTRGDILGGKYGAYETDFAKIGPGFNTAVSDVLIWTGVTNDARYATSKLVLRKIPAASYGKWQMGSPVTEAGRVDEKVSQGDAKTEAQHGVTMTKDYYMGVFEVTQAQYARIVDGHLSSTLTTAWPSYFTESTSRDRRPVEKVTYHFVRGLNSDTEWPSDRSKVASWSFLALLRAKLAGSPLIDLPTEAQWEFACRAGTTTQLNSGLDMVTPLYEGDANLKLLGRTKRSGGYIGGDQLPTAQTPAEQGGTAMVGSYLPNAYGLYDMHGNVAEWCLDFWAVYPEEDQVEPNGPAITTPIEQKRVLRGGHWKNYCRYSRSASRGDFSNYPPCPTYGLASELWGFRLCLTVE